MIIKLKRGTRDSINAAALGNNLIQGEVFLITDENRLGVGLTSGTYETYAKENEAGLKGTTTATLTLTVAGWTANSQTLTVTGVTTTSINLIVIESTVMGTRWGEAKVFATSQGTNSITFNCETTPTEDIEFKVTILN